MPSQITAFNGATNSCCALLEVAVDNLQSIANIEQPNGIFTFIKKDTDTSPVEIKLDGEKDAPKTGSFRKLYTKAVVPECSNTTTPIEVCVAPSFSSAPLSSSNQWIEHTFTTLPIEREIDFDVESFQKFCETPDTYLANKLLAMRQGVIQEINTKTIQALQAYAGQYKEQIGGANNSISNPKAVNLFQSSGTGYNGYALIMNEYGKLGYANSRPYLVGGSSVGTLQGVVGGGYNQAGYQAPVSNPFIGLDYGIDTAFGDANEHYLTWLPGTFIYGTVSEISSALNANQIMRQRERNVVTSPFGDGFMWDYYFDADIATGCKYKMRFKLNFEVLCPVPYVDCMPKPALHFIGSCTENPCPTDFIAI